MFGLKPIAAPYRTVALAKAVPPPASPATLNIGLAHLLGPHGWGFESEIPRPQNYAAMERKFGASAWVYICVRRKARDLASAALKVQQMNADEEFSDVRMDHPLQRVLTKVNPWITTEGLLRITSVYLDLTGNAFWLVYRNQYGMPVELYPINPMAVSIFASRVRMVAGYVVWHYGQPLPFRAFGPGQLGDVIHFKLENPTSDWLSMFPSVWGVGPLEAAWNLVLTDEDSVKWNRNLVKNAGSPVGLMTSEQEVTEEQAQQSAERYRQIFGGPEGVGKLLVLGNNLKYQQMGFNARQLDWVESRRELREEIIATFGLNSAVLGLAQGDVGRRDEAHRDYWEGTVVNTSKSDICPPLNEFLVPEFAADGSLQVVQDFTGVRALQANEELRSGFIVKYWSMGVPFNILNQRFDLGFDPIPGGDTPFVSAAVIPATAGGDDGLPIDVGPGGIGPDGTVTPTASEDAALNEIAALVDPALRGRPLSTRPVRRFNSMIDGKSVVAMFEAIAHAVTTEQDRRRALAADLTQGG